MIISEVIDAIDNIDSITMESEINTCNSLLSSYDKMSLLMENYNGDDIDNFIIFQEGFIDDVKNETKKMGSKQSTIMKILSFIPRVIMAIVKTIGKSLKNNKSIEKAEATLKKQKKNIPLINAILNCKKEDMSKLKKVIIGVLSAGTVGAGTYAISKSIPKDKKGTSTNTKDSDNEKKNSDEKQNKPHNDEKKSDSVKKVTNEKESSYDEKQQKESSDNEQLKQLKNEIRNILKKDISNGGSDSISAWPFLHTRTRNNDFHLSFTPDCIDKSEAYDVLKMFHKGDSAKSIEMATQSTKEAIPVCEICKDKIFIGYWFHPIYQAERFGYNIESKQDPRDKNIRIITFYTDRAGRIIYCYSGYLLKLDDVIKNGIPLINTKMCFDIYIKYQQTHYDDSADANETTKKINLKLVNTSNDNDSNQSGKNNEATVVNSDKMIDDVNKIFDKMDKLETQQIIDSSKDHKENFNKGEKLLGKVGPYNLTKIYVNEDGLLCIKTNIIGRLKNVIDISTYLLELFKNINDKHPTREEISNMSKNFESYSFSIYNGKEQLTPLKEVINSINSYLPKLNKNADDMQSISENIHQIIDKIDNDKSLNNIISDMFSYVKTEYDIIGLNIKSIVEIKNECMIRMELIDYLSNNNIGINFDENPEVKKFMDYYRKPEFY